MRKTGSPCFSCVLSISAFSLRLLFLLLRKTGKCMPQTILEVSPVTTSSGDYRLLPLTQGQFAKVDASDFDWLSQWKWCVSWHPRTNSFYAVRKARKTEGGKGVIFLHRVLLGLDKGNPLEGDHVNLETLDNRRCNLRIATHSQNNHNKPIRRDNKSGYKGVGFHKASGRWRADIRLNGRSKYLGLFDTAEDAYASYLFAAAEMHGEFARFK